MYQPQKEAVVEAQDTDLKDIAAGGIDALRKKRQVEDDESRVAHLQNDALCKNAQRSWNITVAAGSALTQYAQRHRRRGKFFPTKIDEKTDARRFDGSVERRTGGNNGSQSGHGEGGHNERSDGTAEDARHGTAQSVLQRVGGGHQHTGAGRRDRQKTRCQKNKIQIEVHVQRGQLIALMLALLNEDFPDREGKLSPTPF